jgi:hypothetical protein
MIGPRRVSHKVLPYRVRGIGRTPAAAAIVGTHSRTEMELPVKGTPHLNGICPYYTMFPLEFPLRRLQSARKGDWVLDPFCGRGTTNLAARMLGLPSVGLDASPVAVAIALAKLSDASSPAVIAVCRRILKEDWRTSVPRGEFWELCFHPDTLREICQVRSALLKSCRSEARISLRALILGLLHGPLRRGRASYLSNQMPRSYATKPAGAVRFWRKHSMTPPRVSLLELVTRRSPLYIGASFPSLEGRILEHDSRGGLAGVIDHRFSHVITSPPYIGMDHYLRDQWLRNWFVGGPDRPTWQKRDALITEDPERFVAEMAQVWTGVGQVCRKGARLTIRFGSIPGKEVNPTNVIVASLDASDSDWRILTVTDAGVATHGKRQSNQFLESPRKSVREVDIHAVLRNN